MIRNHRFILKVIRSFNCCTERGFSAVVLNKLGNGNHFRGLNHWQFVGHPADVFSLFYQVIFPMLFTRLFFNALEEWERKGCLDFHVTRYREGPGFPLRHLFMMNRSNLIFETCFTSRYEFKVCTVIRKSGPHVHWAVRKKLCFGAWFMSRLVKSSVFFFIFL